MANSSWPSVRPADAVSIKARAAEHEKLGAKEPEPQEYGGTAEAWRKPLSVEITINTPHLSRIAALEAALRNADMQLGRAQYCHERGYNSSAISHVQIAGSVISAALAEPETATEATPKEELVNFWAKARAGDDRIAALEAALREMENIMRAMKNADEDTLLPLRHEWTKKHIAEGLKVTSAALAGVEKPAPADWHPDKDRIAELKRELDVEKAAHAATIELLDHIREIVAEPNDYYDKTDGEQDTI
jgi:hypothetical protein